MLDTKMLIVDDDANICELLKLYFENEGYGVKVANDGVEGLSYFKIYEPDMVLLDEPTNHLDLDTVIWSENYLGGQAGCTRRKAPDDTDGHTRSIFSR
jgi:DNA-binding NtrC family response regulator